jgi:hypothetical protein
VAGTETLSPLQEILDKVDTLMEEGKFGDSAVMLEGSFRDAVRAEVRAEYDRFASKPRVEELTRLTERMIERLEVLGGNQSQGQQLECGTQLPSSITEDTFLQRGCQYTNQEDRIVQSTTNRVIGVGEPVKMSFHLPEGADRRIKYSVAFGRSTLHAGS